MNPAFAPMQMFPIPKTTPLAPALYVGDLDETIQEEFLYDFFSRYGQIHFVRIMRDSHTGKSRGYAFVNFVNARDADAAKLYAQYEKLGNKRIRIMFKRNIREIPTEGNVHVKNIDPSIDVKRLHEFFNEQGAVVSAKISEDKQGNSLGYGYVQYDKQDDAERAIQNLNGKLLGEKELIVEKFVKKQDRITNTEKKNLYIKNLPSGTKEEIEKLVRDNICQGAVITSFATIQKDGKWAAFACLEDAKAAEEIVNRFNVNENPVKLGDAEEPLYVAYHESKGERNKKLSMQHQKEANETNLYVKNLKTTIKREDVEKAFSQFGQITSVDVRTWKSPAGKDAVFGFINFKNKDDASKARTEALTRPEIKDLYIPTEPQYINLHQPKDKRSEFIQSKKRAKNATMFVPPYRFDPYMQMQGMNANRRFGPFTNFYPPRNQQPRGNMGGPQFNRGPQDQNRGGYPQQQRPYQQNKPMQQGGYNNRGPQQGRNMQQQKPGQYQQNNQLQKKPDNKPQQKPQVQQAQQQAAASSVSVSSLKTKLNEFLAQSQDKQRQILGELLFPKIRARTTETLAPKITGMLIDLSVLEVSEILEFLEDENLLNERIVEAKELIESGEN